MTDSIKPAQHANLIRYLAPALTIAAFIALAVAGYHLQDTLQPRIDTALAADPTCDLRQGPCVLALPNGGAVHLAIKPRSIPLLEPLKVEVVVTNTAASAVEVDFVGVDMNMGYNRVRLTKQAEGRFTGEITLPVCVRRRMNWEARVLIDTPEGRILAPFLFYTIKGGTAP